MGDGTRESIRRSYELIQKTERLVLKSRDLLRLYISHRPYQTQTLEPKK